VRFTTTALNHYLEWQTADKKMAARINELIKDIQRNGFMKGLGKPEALKGERRSAAELTTPTAWYIPAMKTKI
jgi:Txe/YoeB family toxin of Txe-Axe toxin-antitoxin module